jgi:hypothetical protein
MSVPRVDWNEASGDGHKNWRPFLSVAANLQLKAQRLEQYKVDIIDKS